MDFKTFFIKAVRRIFFLLRAPYFPLRRFKRKHGFPTLSIVYYWADQPNFGDAVNHYLLQYMGCKHLRSDRYLTANPHLWDGVAIGSLMEFLYEKGRSVKYPKDPIKVSGSGFIYPTYPEGSRFMRPLEIYALRGKLSKERCEQLTGQNLDHIVLGDPGLLIKRIFPNIIRTPKYDVGIVYHRNEEYTHPAFDKIRLENKTYRIISHRLKPEVFVQALAECKFILASAMHALICADSLGIPNKQMIASSEVEGGNFKFRDYYSVFPNYHYSPVDLREPLIVTDELIEQWTEEYNITPQQVDNICDKLEAVFPFPRSLRSKNRIS